MSVLHSRIMAHGAGDSPGAVLHPYGTGATPMTMPLMTVDYSPDLQAVYGTAHPLVAADGAVIAARSHRAAQAPHIGATVPAGRP
jgi:hypothetical protein